jgi:hypothetical protein
VLQLTKKRALTFAGIISLAAIALVVFRASGYVEGYTKDDVARIRAEFLVDTAAQYCKSLPNGKRAIDGEVLVAAEQIRRDALIDPWGGRIELLQVEGTCSFSARMQPPPAVGGERQHR